MESIIQNPVLAFIAILATGILASLPGIYATWTQRKRIKAEGVTEDAQAAKIITEAYTKLQASYVDMIEAIRESYKECNEKMELLTNEVEELHKENKALREQIKVLELVIVDFKEEMLKE
jgi:cell shape-determining protein MreC